jgi:hypothetical protein
MFSGDTCIICLEKCDKHIKEYRIKNSDCKCNYNIDKLCLKKYYINSNSINCIICKNDCYNINNIGEYKDIIYYKSICNAICCIFSHMIIIYILCIVLLLVLIIMI